MPIANVIPRVESVFRMPIQRSQIEWLVGLTHTVSHHKALKRCSFSSQHPTLKKLDPGTCVRRATEVERKRLALVLSIAPNPLEAWSI